MKILVVILLSSIICGCATSKYQVQPTGEKIFTPEKVKSDSYQVETEDK